MVTNILCIIKLIDIFYVRIPSDDPENFLGGGEGHGARSTTVLPLKILCQDESDKVLPL